MRNYLKNRYTQRRAQALAILGGKCAQCGSTDRLQFDHIEHALKSFDIADRLAQYTWTRLMRELSKCQLLCFDCHVAKSKDEDAQRRAAGSAGPLAYARQKEVTAR